MSVSSSFSSSTDARLQQLLSTTNRRTEGAAVQLGLLLQKKEKLDMERKGIFPYRFPMFKEERVFCLDRTSSSAHQCVNGHGCIGFSNGNMEVGILCVMDKRFTTPHSIVVGTHVQKYFEQGRKDIFTGKVTEIWTSINERTQEASTLYQVTFQDGDMQDYSFNEIVDWLRPKYADESLKLQTCLKCILNIRPFFNPTTIEGFWALSSSDQSSLIELIPKENLLEILRINPYWPKHVRSANINWNVLYDIDDIIKNLQNESSSDDETLVDDDVDGAGEEEETDVVTSSQPSDLTRFRDDPSTVLRRSQHVGPKTPEGNSKVKSPLNSRRS